MADPISILTGGAAGAVKPTPPKSSATGTLPGGSWAGEAARNGAGTTMAGTGTGGLGANASIAELEAYIRKTYGYMSGFLNIPEVRTVLLDAARKGSGPDELYGMLSATNWWKTSSAASRQWQQLLSEDPATAKAQAATVAASINDIAKSHGLALSAQQIGDLAMQASQFGWSQTETLNAILKNVQWGKVEGGTLTATVDQIKQVAGDYMVGMSDATAQGWSTRIASGELTIDGVRSILQQQAVARWPYMADLIGQGLTPKDYFAAPRDTIASTLEVGADTIDMMDPKYLKMLEVRDPKSGELRAATMNEAMLAARRMPEWASTKNAQDLTANMVSGLQQAFGRN